MTPASTPAPFWRRHRLVLAATLLLLLAVAAPLVSAWRDHQPAYGGRVLMDWAADLTAQDPARSAAAREAVKALGPEAVPTLIRVARQPDPILARPLLQLAEYLPRPTYGTLVRWVNPGGGAAARRQALNALAVLGPEAEPALPTLARIVRQPPDKQRYPDWVVAVQALGRLGPAAVPSLLQALSNAPETLRGHLLFALTDTGPAAREAIPRVLALLAKQPDLNRSALAEFLCAAGGDKALPHLYPRLTDLDPDVRANSAAVLAEMAESSAEVRAAMMAASSAESAPVRLELVQSLGRLDRLRPEVARAMLRALDDPDGAIRAEARRWLRQRLSPTQLDRLLASEPAEVQSRLRPLLEAGPAVPP